MARRRRKWGFWLFGAAAAIAATVVVVRRRRFPRGPRRPHVLPSGGPIVRDDEVIDVEVLTAEQPVTPPPLAPSDEEVFLPRSESGGVVMPAGFRPAGGV